MTWGGAEEYTEQYEAMRQALEDRKINEAIVMRKERELELERIRGDYRYRW